MELEWTRRVYRALVGEVPHGSQAQQGPDASAALVVDTLLHGAGDGPAPTDLLSKGIPCAPTAFGPSSSPLS
ncbi:hypothetical protein [Streptomyces sp. NPDC020747]|uniref:hypothetical protein n=1 Tax=Streptomyces sp. NPDC020747 TaxID=3365086 RepID=UPI0037AAE5A8